MVTESVIPLEEYLKENRNELEISWGIHQIAVRFYILGAIFALFFVAHILAH
jgi:hypothetical protein